MDKWDFLGTYITNMVFLLVYVSGFKNNWNRKRQLYLRLGIIITAAIPLAVVCIKLAMQNMSVSYRLMVLIGFIPSVVISFFQYYSKEYRAILNVIRKNFIIKRVKPKLNNQVVIDVLNENEILTFIEFRNKTSEDLRLNKAVETAVRELNFKYEKAFEFLKGLNRTDLENIRYVVINGPEQDYYAFESKRKYPFKTLDILTDENGLGMFHKLLIENGYEQAFSSQFVENIAGRNPYEPAKCYEPVNVKEKEKPINSASYNKYTAIYYHTDKAEVRLCTEVYSAETQQSALFTEQVLENRKLCGEAGFYIPAPKDALILLLFDIFEKTESLEANFIGGKIKLYGIAVLKCWIDKYRNKDFWKNVESEIKNFGFEKTCGTVLKNYSDVFGKRALRGCMKKISHVKSRWEHTVVERWQNPNLTLNNTKEGLRKYWSTRNYKFIYKPDQAIRTVDTKSEFITVKEGTDFRITDLGGRLSHAKIPGIKEKAGGEPVVLKGETLLMDWKFNKSRLENTADNLYEIRFYPLNDYPAYMVWKVQLYLENGSRQAYGRPTMSMNADTYKEVTERNYNIYTEETDTDIMLRIKMPIEELGMENNKILNKMCMTAGVYKHCAGNIYLAENGAVTPMYMLTLYDDTGRDIW